MSPSRRRTPSPPLGTRAPPSPDRTRGASPDRGRSPSPGLGPRGPAAAAVVRPPGALAHSTFANRLMEVEERFNRQMEDSRRIDLESKTLVRERHRQDRLRCLDELRALSDQKAVALVALMDERERELEAKFREELEGERRRWAQEMQKAHPQLRVPGADAEGARLAGVVRRLQAENARLKAELGDARGPAGPRKPLFGLEVEDRGEAGVRVASVQGPSLDAGLQPHDLIRRFTLSLPVRSSEDFRYAAGKADAGDRVSLEVVRGNGDAAAVTVTAGVRAIGKLESARGGWRGAEAEGASDGAMDPLPGEGQPSPPITTDEFVQHISRDGVISYVPMSALLHRSTKQSPSPGP